VQPNSQSAKESIGVGRRDGKMYALIPFTAIQRAVSLANSGDICLESNAMATPLA
jgi:hypothetical protein